MALSLSRHLKNAKLLQQFSGLCTVEDVASGDNFNNYTGYSGAVSKPAVVYSGDFRVYDV